MKASRWRPMLALGVALVVALVVATPSTAAPDEGTCGGDVLAALQRQLDTPRLRAAESAGSLVAEACKPWPQDGRLLLAAIAYDSGVEYEKSLVVAILDRKSLRLVAAHRDVITEDAVTEAGQGSLQLDTARYRLAPNVHAFGLRFTSTARGPSCADASEWDELTLFIQDEAALRPVLRRPMQFQNALRGCIGNATGQDVWEQGRRTLSVAGTVSHGLADLRVTETVTVDGNLQPMPGDIDTRRKVGHQLLRYDGKQYR